MSGSVNKVTLIGNLGRDPEVRRTKTGDPIVRLQIATTEEWRDKQTRERRQKTEWHTVIIFNINAANFAEQYLRKGMKIYAEGQLQTRKWQDSNNGQDRYTTEIVLRQFRGELLALSGRSDGSSSTLQNFDDEKSAGPDRETSTQGQLTDTPEDFWDTKTGMNPTDIDDAIPF